MKLSVIVAMAQNNVIGRENALPWHLSADMKRFREITTGHTIVMGRRTFESIGKPLPNRRNIILSNTLTNGDIEGCEIFHSLDEFMNSADNKSDEEAFIIGGGKLYKHVMDNRLADTLRVTLVHCSPYGDTFFPVIEEGEWKETCRESYKANEKNDFDFDFIDYVRI